MRFVSFASKMKKSSKLYALETGSNGGLISVPFEVGSTANFYSKHYTSKDGLAVSEALDLASCDRDLFAIAHAAFGNATVVPSSSWFKFGSTAHRAVGVEFEGTMVHVSTLLDAPS